MAQQVDVTRYQRRPAEVEAIQLTADNATYVAEWCGGRADLDDMGDPVVHLPKTTIPVTLGGWAVRDILPDGIGEAHAMGDQLFGFCYQPVGEGHRHRRREDIPTEG